MGELGLCACKESCVAQVQPPGDCGARDKGRLIGAGETGWVRHLGPFAAGLAPGQKSAQAPEYKETIKD